MHFDPNLHCPCEETLHPWLSKMHRENSDQTEQMHMLIWILTLVLLSPDIPAFANSVDPDQLASEEANWSGSALFAIKYVNLHQQPGSSNLIGWK